MTLIGRDDDETPGPWQAMVRCGRRQRLQVVQLLGRRTRLHKALGRHVLARAEQRLRKPERITVPSENGRIAARCSVATFEFTGGGGVHLHLYRLAVIRIGLRPLRERPEDIRWLTERMLQQIAIEQGRPVAISEAFMRDVMARTWKGNARELRSYLEEAVVLSEAGILDVPDAAAARCVAASQVEASGEFAPLQAMVEEAERRHIRSALDRTGGSVMKTSELLGISRKTLWERMKKLNVENEPGSNHGAA